MHGRITSNRKTAARRSLPSRRCTRNAFTLTEVVVASALLISAIVPILKALTSVHLHASMIEQKTRCLNIAQTRLEEIKARSIYSYNAAFAETNTTVDGAYLRTVSDTAVSPNLRRIVVSCGYDTDRNGVLAAGETLITLQTLIARRW